jgi:2-dehydropantoate 2-reductase
MNYRRIAIIGAGALGCYYGGRLQLAGHEVHFLTRSECATLREKGLTVQSYQGDFSIGPEAIRVYDEPGQLPEVDLAIVTLKSTAKASYLAMAEACVGTSTAILCLQNGFGNEQVFADRYGAERVMGAIAYTCIFRDGPGRVKHTSHGTVRLGEFAEGSMARVNAIASLMTDAKIDARPIDDLRQYRWDKLAWNIPYNGWGAALDQHCAQLMASESGLSLLRDTMNEVVRAARFAGVTLPATTADDQIKRTWDAGAYVTSMQLDRRQGRAMEIDAIIAEPIRQARAGGCESLPLMESIERSLRAIDGARGISPGSFGR